MNRVDGLKTFSFGPGLALTQRLVPRCAPMSAAKVALEFTLPLKQDCSRRATLPYLSQTSSYDHILVSRIRLLLTRLHLETTRPSATTGTLELPALALDVRLL